MKNKQGGAGKTLTFGASWCGEGACSSFRILLLTTCPALVGAWEDTDSETGLFLGADDGASGWLCVVVFPEWSELGSPRLDCVSSLRLSSVEAYIREKERVSMC